ncbi:MAG: hypothetical protein BWY17_05344 [Deltaproteobacteria bacterium ADurb.Bin207]|nr:MAG: hypothetical protein BWY17_05344 [Deltaproteobacteria bacterium ADurb.Bin207]
MASRLNASLPSKAHPTIRGRPSQPSSSASWLESPSRTSHGMRRLGSPRASPHSAQLTVFIDVSTRLIPMAPRARSKSKSRGFPARIPFQGKKMSGSVSLRWSYRNSKEGGTSRMDGWKKGSRVSAISPPRLPRVEWDTLFTKKQGSSRHHKNPTDSSGYTVGSEMLSNRPILPIAMTPPRSARRKAPFDR